MSNWYEDFFNGLALEFWKKAVTPEQTRIEAEFLLRTLDPPSGAELLDVPCGTGRHAVELATRGFKLTAVDLSAEFLAQAKTGTTIEWLRRDMRDLPWSNRFDGAYCVGNSFGYLDHEGNREFLVAVAKTLKPGASFVLETGVVAETILPSLQPQRWFKLDDLYMMSTHKYDAASSVLTSDYIFMRDGVQENRQARYTVYTSAELQRTLKQAGFDVTALYGGYDGADFRIGSNRLIVAARRIR